LSGLALAVMRWRLRYGFWARPIPAVIDAAMARTTTFLAAAPQKFQRFGTCAFHLAAARAKREKVAALEHVAETLHVKKRSACQGHRACECDGTRNSTSHAVPCDGACREAGGAPVGRGAGAGKVRCARRSPAGSIPNYGHIACGGCCTRPREVQLQHLGKIMVGCDSPAGWMRHKHVR
jgi:hypothetical protein